MRKVHKYIKDMDITEPKETNLEHYYNEIIAIAEKGFDIAVDETNKPVVCDFLNCKDCVFGYDKCTKKLYEWFASPYEKKPKYKLTQFEYDVLDTMVEKNARFNKLDTFRELRVKGYFNGIECDDNTRVKDILEDCEVIENDK